MHIILNIAPPTLPYLLIKPKQAIRKGDTIIFQTSVPVEGHEPDIEEVKKVVETVSAPDTDGLMKGWQLCTFKEEA